MIRRCRALLGTFVEVAVPAGREAALAAAFARIAHIQARMSFHEESSDLAALRRAEHGTEVVVDPATTAVLALAARLHTRSSGLFDVTIGARLVATGFLPRPPGVDLRRRTGTAADIQILDDGRIRCRRPLLIDLGGIAKGYAVDCAVETLLAAGIDRALVNAGGDLRVIGSDTVHLRGANGSIDAVMTLTDSALASSSNRHLRRRHRGRVSVPHLGAGRVALLTDAAVSVVAPQCAVADAMTKIAMAAPALAAQMLDELGGALIARTARKSVA
ncbi:MAG: FAD:protein FMN transferase [Steroidobacteraceae bacterium]